MSVGAWLRTRRPGSTWLATAAAGALLAVVGVRVVGELGGAAAGRRWLAVTGIVVAGELAYLGYLLRRRDGGRPSPGAATAVTLVRGLLYAAAGGFLLVSPGDPLLRWAPGLCYGAGAALDFVDGRLARRLGATSELGARLDHAFDTTGFLVAPLVGVAWGRLPVWYLSLSAARYVFRAGTWWRRRTGRPVHPLPESALRRRLAALQMAVVTGALLPLAPAPAVHVAATVALVPSLAGFARDWLAVSGRLPRHEE